MCHSSLPIHSTETTKDNYNHTSACVHEMKEQRSRWTLTVCKAVYQSFYIYYFLWLLLQHKDHYYSSLRTLLKVPRPVQKIRQDWSSNLMIVSCCSLFDQGFPSGSNGKRICLQCRRLGSIPGSGRSPGVGNGNPLQYSCLENSIHREAWWATVHGVTKSWTQLSN